MHHLSDLTSKQRARLLYLLATDAVTVEDYYPDLYAERVRQANTFRTAILKRNGRHEVWFEDSVAGLTCAGAFTTHVDAQEAESMGAQLVLAAIDSYLVAQRDEEWSDRPICEVEWAYPMVFTDASDYAYSWDLLNEGEVIEFFKRFRSCIFEPLAADSLYWWTLVDANGVYCEPVRNHRGVIRLEEPEVQPVFT